VLDLRFSLRKFVRGAIAVSPVVLLAAASACSSDPPSRISLFAVPGGPHPPADFYELPFPNGIRRTADGHPDLSDFPKLNPTIDLFPAAITQGLDGFGLNAAMFVRFGGPVDTKSLPRTPDDSLMDTASVYLVNVDQASPDYTVKTPIQYRFEAKHGSVIGPNWLSVLPYPGFPLDEGTTYALVVTKRVTIGGAAAIPSDDFTAIIATDKPNDVALAAAQATYQPLWDYLDEPGGDERADVVDAAVFTTQHATDIMPAIRRKVASLTAPSAIGLTRYLNASTFLMYDGMFAIPNFQSGDVPYKTTGGEIQLDAAGLPIVQRMEPVRFSFAIPTTVAPAFGWPVVIFDPGTGGTYHSFYDTYIVDRLADIGVAVISIDPVLSGSRDPNGNPEQDFYNFANPQAARNNVIQGAADNFSIMSFLQTFLYIEPAAPPSNPGRTIRFDPGNVYFFGHSQGGLTGVPFLAVDPDVKAAVLSGTGALLFETLIGKTKPFDIASAIAAVIPDVPVDEYNPVLAMLQTWVEQSEPANYASMIARAPATGDNGQKLAPKDVFQSEGFDDHWVPNKSLEAFATVLGGNQVLGYDGLMPWPTVQGLRMRNRSVLKPPISGNLNGKTVVLDQFRMTAGSDGHFVVFDQPDAEAAWTQFLQTRVTTGVATLSP